jgi:ssDNA-binding Zn-finger/Zn-ribbon topoisomerase 1
MTAEAAERHQELRKDAIVVNDTAKITKPCKRCGRLLIERTNRETGESFLGCPSWPDCTYTEPLPESIKLRRQGQKGLFDE